MRSYDAVTGESFAFIHTMFVMVLFVSTIVCDVFSEQMILLEFNESMSDPSNLWSSLTGRIADNCTTIGVSCNSNRSVRELCISGNYSISSYSSKIFELPLHAVGIKINCSGLDGNLVGNLPAVIGELTELGAFLLQCNNLTSEFPVGILLLKNLKELDLEGKLVSENILICDSSYSRRPMLNCIELTTLLLSSNTSNGSIPSEFGRLRRLEVLEVSGNGLKGPDPSELGKLTNLLNCNLSSHFSRTGTIHDIREYVPQPAPFAFVPVPQKDLNVSTDTVSSTKFNVAVLCTLTTAAFALLSMFLLLLYACIYRGKKSSNSSVEIAERSQRGGITIVNDIGIPLSYEIVNQATGNFSSANCIGRGGFGTVYRAEVSAGIRVAVKKFSSSQQEGVPQFHAEVDILRRIYHRHIVNLIGFHSSANEMFLICNYISGGNLEEYILEREVKGFSWIKLHKISLNIASAVSYLHDHFNPPVLHRDIKPSNILLDLDDNAYLSDFGLSMLLFSSDSDAQADVVGTYEYVAPEYAMASQLSDKIDVYSYGVTLLELMSTMRAMDPSFQSYEYGFNIVSWARMQTEYGNEMDVFSPVLRNNGPQHKLVQMLHVALMCTTESPAERPRMAQVVDMLTALEADAS